MKFQYNAANVDTNEEAGAASYSSLGDLDLWTWMTSQPHSRRRGAATEGILRSAGCASCRMKKVEIHVKRAVYCSRRERKSLLKVFLLKVWVLLEQLLAIGIGRQNIQHTPHGDSHATDARLAAHLVGLDGYPVEWWLEVHVLIISHENETMEKMTRTARAARSSQG